MHLVPDTPEIHCFYKHLSLWYSDLSSVRRWRLAATQLCHLHFILGTYFFSISTEAIHRDLLFSSSWIPSLSSLVLRKNIIMSEAARIQHTQPFTSPRSISRQRYHGALPVVRVSRLKSYGILPLSYDISHTRMSVSRNNAHIRSCVRDISKDACSPVEYEDALQKMSRAAIHWYPQLVLSCHTDIHIFSYRAGIYFASPWVDLSNNLGWVSICRI